MPDPLAMENARCLRSAETCGSTRVPFLFLVESSKELTSGIVPQAGLGPVSVREDDRVLAAAVAAGVDYVGTGDRQLRRLGSSG